MTNVQIYVGTYGKYNNGSIKGDWLCVNDYCDYSELFIAMKELHKDEIDPEFMFQDYECPKYMENMNLIGESFISPIIFKLLDIIESSEIESSIIESYFECFGFDSEHLDNLIENIHESYNGSFQSDEEFTEELLIDTGTIPDNFPTYIYIDWEKTSRDIMMDYSESNTHYFRNI